MCMEDDPGASHEDVQGATGDDSMACPRHHHLDGSYSELNCENMISSGYLCCNLFFTFVDLLRFLSILTHTRRL